MKIACLTQVRNEADIIETFCRHNLKVCDHLFIINNNSVDNTSLILEKLKSENLPITTAFDSNEEFNQTGLITNSLHWAAKKNEFDWFVFLDADEFICHSKSEVLSKLHSTPNGGIPSLQWRTWVPVPNVGVKCLVNENKIYKIAVNKANAPHVRISWGSHEAYVNSLGKLIPSKWSGLRLEHFPIRSINQIIVKAMMSDRAIRNKLKNRPNTPRQYIQDIFEKIRNKNFNVTGEDILEWAKTYTYTSNSIIDDNSTFLPASTELKYKELAYVNPLEIMDKTFNK